MAVKHFTDLEVWRRSHQLFLTLLAEVDQIPVKRGTGIVVDQTLRSIGSVGANIAEGFNRSKKKYLNSLDIALGEASEAENWLYKLRDSGYLDSPISNGHIRETIEIQKMLNELTRSIQRSEETSRPRKKRQSDT
jgi:four helix bundle protein